MLNVVFYHLQSRHNNIPFKYINIKETNEKVIARMNTEKLVRNGT